LLKECDNLRVTGFVDGGAFEVVTAATICGGAGGASVATATTAASAFL